VGLTFNQKSEHWQYDIGNATASAIDGFALNIGAGDNHTLEALHGAYDSAAKLGNFSLFLSFDFGATGNWTVESVASLINDFRDEPAQFKVNGKPLVSTFEGFGFAEKWKDVRRKVPGDIYFVPDWSSLGYEGIQNVTNEIDGHFSFDAWPQREETTITTRIDKLYQKVLGSTRSYMMGVSPYFYTSRRTDHPLFGPDNATCPVARPAPMLTSLVDLKSLSKNWYSSSDSLWFDRLEQMVDLQPDLAQIISWNDFGESHYISEIREEQVLDQAKPYVDGFNHEGLRAVLPWYIAAYKAGSRDIPMPPSLGDGVAVAWYRTTPANLTKCDDGGSHWGQNGTLTAKAAVVDAINIIAIAAKPDTTVSITLGSGVKTLPVPPGEPRFFQISFKEFERPVGKVQIIMKGVAGTEGPEITDKCPKTGIVSLSLSMHRRLLTCWTDQLQCSCC